MKFQIFSFLIVCHLLVVLPVAQGLRGRVIDPAGKPIKGAIIQPSGMLINALTDEDGYFVLDDERMKYFRGLYSKEIVFVNHLDYELKIIFLEPKQTELLVTLSAPVDEIIALEPCSAKVPKGFKRAGHFFKLTFPKSMKIKKDSNFEYSWISIKTTSGGREEEVDSTIGFKSTLYPSTLRLIESSEFKVQRTEMGIDFRGRDRDGTYWRHIGGIIGMFDTGRHR
jgi:hypothetical protein